MYQIHNWMIDSVHYFSENNNCITINNIILLLYISKRTRLTPKMTIVNCNVVCKRERFKWIEYLSMFEDKPITLFIVNTYNITILYKTIMQYISFQVNITKVEDLHCIVEINLQAMEWRARWYSSYNRSIGSDLPSSYWGAQQIFVLSYQKQLHHLSRHVS